MVNRVAPIEIYSEIVKWVPIVCVDVAILYHGKILLVKRKNNPAKGEWWLPGGRVMKCEFLEQAAIRKTREEVGIDCMVGPLIMTDETVFYDGPWGESVHSVNSVFMMLPIKYDTEVVLDTTSSKYLWTDTILSSYNIYVQKCMRAAGIKKKKLDHHD